MIFKDAHVHIGTYEEVKDILNNSQFTNKYRVYSSIELEIVKEQEKYLQTIDDFFAMPIIFKETNIQEANKKIIKIINNYDKGIPVTLLDNNKNFNENIEYLIMKEHFLLHKADNYKDRGLYYEYLNNYEGFVILHCKDNIRTNYIKLLRENFPKMNIIVAHLGRNTIENQNEILNILNTFKFDEKIYFDFSTVKNIETILLAIKIIGSDRILYGSDFPYEFSLEKEQNRKKMLIEKLKYNEDILLKVNGDNFERIKSRIRKKTL